MKVISLFDGMACGMLAFQSAGINVDRYVAFEIDKYAVQTSSHNFPIIEHCGDVFQADFSEFRGFDFLVGGSPCTYWSIAQKNNRETEASGMGWELFSQYVRALREAQPLYFIYENNKSMAKAIRESITETFGFEPICINSALVSAQNRQRLYWVGKRNADGTYSRVKVDQPKDRGILLRDILDCGCSWMDKSFAYTTRCQGATIKDTLERRRHTMVAAPVAINTTADGDKARTLMAGYYKYGTATLITNEGFTGGTTAVAEPVGIGYMGRMENGKWVKRYESNEEPKANALTTAQTDSMVAESVPVFATPCEWGESGKPTKAIYCSDGKTYPVYEVKDGQITIKGKQYPIKLEDGFYIIRKLTISECKRLQTVPEWYEFPVSDTQAYKMLGNGWTVEVIAHLIKATQSDEIEEEQLRWF